MTQHPSSQCWDTFQPFQTPDVMVCSPDSLWQSPPQWTSLHKSPTFPYTFLYSKLSQGNNWILTQLTGRDNSLDSLWVNSDWQLWILLQKVVGTIVSAFVSPVYGVVGTWETGRQPLVCVSPEYLSPPQWHLFKHFRKNRWIQFSCHWWFPARGISSSQVPIESRFKTHFADVEILTF